MASTSFSFRPCIDLRNGKVTQIVGSTLKDAGPSGNGTSEAQQVDAVTNFITDVSPAKFAEKYKQSGLKGGHVIMLDHSDANEAAALQALAAFPGGFHVGGGITPDNALKYLKAGASHVIVTSFVFREGRVDMERLKQLVDVVGKDRLVLDLSCRRKLSVSSSGDDDQKVDAEKDGSVQYFVVTDRWQRFTDVRVDTESLTQLSRYCSEFLVHGVDVEGKQQGIEQDLVRLLQTSPIPVTYAGGIRSLEDIQLVRRLGAGKVSVTVGSALDIFGGALSYDTVVSRFRTNADCNDGVSLQKTIKETKS